MKKINLYGDLEKNRPLVLANVFESDGSALYEECRKLTDSDFNLAAVSGIEWEKELSPWKIEPIFKGDDYAGEADNYLKEILEDILPGLYSKLSPCNTYLAGYSLAGLFATYVSFKTDIFSGIISASGSLWYPDFLEFVRKNNISTNIKGAYFSLGDSEKNVRNEIMKTVEEKSEAVKEVFKEKGKITVFEKNPGNHFKNPDFRTAKGIKWMLENINI